MNNGMDNSLLDAYLYEENNLFLIYFQILPIIL